MDAFANRRRRHCRGAAMIEFALTFPVLIMMLFGFVEVGRALYQGNTLTKSLSTGARFIAREPEALDKTTCATGAAWATASARAAELVVFTGGGSGPARHPGLQTSDVSFTPRADSVSGNPDPACVIEATVQAEFNALLGDIIVPFLDLGPIVFNIVEEERYIGD